MPSRGSWVAGSSSRVKSTASVPAPPEVPARSEESYAALLPPPRKVTRCEAATPSTPGSSREILQPESGKPRPVRQHGIPALGEGPAEAGLVGLGPAEA